MTTPPEPRYATTEDGISIAYQAIGDGPLDLVLEFESWGNVELMWELPALADLFDRLSSFSRLILHDRRGTGLSGGRGSPFPNLETRTRDLLLSSTAFGRGARRCSGSGQAAPPSRCSPRPIPIASRPLSGTDRWRRGDGRPSIRGV